MLTILAMIFIFGLLPYVWMDEQEDMVVCGKHLCSYFTENVQSK